MAAAVESGSRPQKIPKLDEQAVVEPKRIRYSEPEKDEYVRQYLQFHCQFHRTKGFGIEWEPFDYFFYECDPVDRAPLVDRIKTNEEMMKGMTNLAIDNYNKDKGTKLVLIKHVSANLRFVTYVTAYWVTFWARDVSSPCPVSKLYQAKILVRALTYQFPIFRLKPTHEEMMAAHVKTPYPMPYHEIGKPHIIFRRAGPGEEPVSGTPFVFSRDGGEFVESETESDDEYEWNSEDDTFDQDDYEWNVMRRMS